MSILKPRGGIYFPDPKPRGGALSLVEREETSRGIRQNPAWKHSAEAQFDDSVLPDQAAALAQLAFARLTQG